MHRGFKQWLQWTFKIPADLALVLPHSCHILSFPFAKDYENIANRSLNKYQRSFIDIHLNNGIYLRKRGRDFKNMLAVIKMASEH